MVPRVLRPDLPDPDVFLFSKDPHQAKPEPAAFFLIIQNTLHAPQIPLPSRPPKLYPALPPRRRRITEFSKLNSSAARERSSNALDGTKLGSNRTCTNYIHPIPYIKVLRSAMNPWIHWFISDRPSFPRISTRTTAPTSNRRRMTLVSRPRTISCGLGRHQIGEQTELHKLYPSHPLYKSFAERNESLDSLVHKRPSPPRSPRLPSSPKNAIPALPPRRRRMTLVSRPRTISCGLGRNQIGEQTELHKLYPSHPLYKSFAELFQKRPFPSFPRSPRSPVPRSPSHSNPYERCIYHEKRIAKDV